MKITSTMPTLDIHTTNAVMEITSEPVRLKVDAQPSQMKVTRTRPKFKANWVKARSQMGQRSPSYQKVHQQQKVQREYRQDLAQAVIDGNRVSDTAGTMEGGPEVMAQIAMERTMRQSAAPELNVSSMPSEPLEMEWEPGDLSIEWTRNSLELSWEGDYRPRISVTPHSVEIRLIDGETVRVRESEAAEIERRGQGKRIDEKI